MMDWIFVISYLITNTLRLLCGLFFVSRSIGFFPEKRSWFYAAASGVLVTILPMASFPIIGALAVELLFISGITWYDYRKKRNLCLFFAFFYEVAIGQWDFLLQAGFGILFSSGKYICPDAPESLVGIWLVRLFMTGVVMALKKWHPEKEKIIQVISILGVAGLLGTVMIPQQSVLSLDENQIDCWILLSVILLFAILFYRANRQHEMEMEIAKLKQDRADIVERDYEALRRTYAQNAKFYHDLHNHMESIYQCLIQGEIGEAIRYCEDLRIPVQTISQAIWTGDKAIDYFISSKLALAEKEKIRAQVDVEYPHNTNIRSVDLTTILGNLLDNALEAAKTAPDPLRFFHLTIRRINAMLIIKVENGYRDTPTREKGRLVTSKTDKVLHGWGIKSVQTAVDHYDGTLRTDYKDGVFQAVVILSFQPIKII